MKLRSFIDISEASSLQPYILVFYLTAAGPSQTSRRLNWP